MAELGAVEASKTHRICVCSLEDAVRFLTRDASPLALSPQYYDGVLVQPQTCIQTHVGEAAAKTEPAAGYRHGPGKGLAYPHTKNFLPALFFDTRLILGRLRLPSIPLWPMNTFPVILTELGQRSSMIARAMIFNPRHKVQRIPRHELHGSCRTKVESDKYPLVYPLFPYLAVYIQFRRYILLLNTITFDSAKILLPKSTPIARVALLRLDHLQCPDEVLTEETHVSIA